LNILNFTYKVCILQSLSELEALTVNQKSFQRILRLSLLYCRMSGISVGTQRDTVKDMVLAGYQVPKGVSVYKSF
jgi:hypothetical protein